MFRGGESIKQAKPARQRLKLRPTAVSGLEAPTIGRAKRQARAGMPPPVKLLLVQLLAIRVSGNSFRQSRLFLFTVTSRALHCSGAFLFVLPCLAFHSLPFNLLTDSDWFCRRPFVRRSLVHNFKISTSKLGPGHLVPHDLSLNDPLLLIN